ncbi:hypothetical protein C8J55DRAFT_86962 [Lentinula edodes]|uniref:Uncharacterized protein n=1 Tax=Lentinula lateritia TaxID=40482 RepID=A0A9W9ACF5_9AGAR|nr:hypothetical protein C8J55DRAFT_86962 [Lentinula edodes]
MYLGGSIIRIIGNAIVQHLPIRVLPLLRPLLGCIYGSGTQMEWQSSLVIVWEPRASPAASTTTSWDINGAPVTIVSVSQGPSLTLGTGSTTVVGSSTYTVAPAPTATTTTSWDFNGAPVTVVSVFSGPVLTLGATGSTTTVNGATYTVAPSSISVSMSTSWGASGAVTMMSASGGPELTLAASGQTTTVGSSTYTVVPTSVASSSVSVSTSTSWGPSGAVTMISASGGPDLTLASTGATTTIGTSVYTVISPSAPSVSTSTSWGPSGAVTYISASGSTPLALATSGFTTVIGSSSYTVATTTATSSHSPSNAAGSLRPFGFSSVLVTGMIAMVMSTLLGGFVCLA